MADSNPGGSTERYEFDAPTHVVDFNELASNESDDTWFEKLATGTDYHLNTPARQDWPTRANVFPQGKTDVDTDAGTSVCSPPNVMSSGGQTGIQTDAYPRRTANQQLPTQPRRVSKRKEVTKSSAPPAAASAAPPSKKHKMTPVSQGTHSILRRSLRRSGQFNFRTGLRRSGQLNERTAPKKRTSTTENTETRKKVTNSSAPPATPPSKKHKMQFSSEEQELKRIRNLQKEVALQRKNNEASYKAALAGDPSLKKTTLSTTVPKEFNFNAATVSSAAHKDVDFVNQLCKPVSPVKPTRGATIPKPFNLSKGKKRKVEELGTYVPMAQRIEQFEKQTPDRYHLQSRRSQERGPCAVKGDCLKLTQPHTPNLMTRLRSRPPTVKSSADLEAAEVDKIHKFKFKALELNKKILESAEDLKKPAVKEPTVPEGFELQIEKRLQERQASKKRQEAEEKPHMFKSQPLPKKILEGVVGLPEKRVLHPTVPESPAFALKKRIHVSQKVVEVKQPFQIKVHPVPHFGLPFKPQLPENHQVEVCPFSFEERERKALKEKKLEQKHSEEVPNFKAQPLPDFNIVHLPEKKKLEPTRPEPFRLLVEERGAVKSNRLELMIKEEQKQQEEASTFKARPNTVTYKEPFKPKREERTVKAVEAFELSTERRARERHEYDRLANDKAALRSLVEEKQRQEEEERQKEEVSRLRKEQVHKAQPIRHYKPVAVKRSELPLTVPQSPNFSDRFRL